ncbi:MAG: aminotransferase class V-fold PLP-dependent enzyme [Planctomycetaceae bacterium]|jgi:D-glucosaminate-6-phosphate ammonia-lyase|nr:aminotransferase class V-fold PLP-dependent enzyme [Planctomycetaceae bacterium]MBT6153429.1 aminotransferase class V-fold PLP-dependent enzyme [Planctomycetaceae bacterium]MBT6487302.1 aminotransferase class V-fold PLP-dependent enzyme [Planctomycetaceae bacterium]MBT6493699.1 aminotransferase class V-fold PLP-dependent enzyme [Planctomycetaceae bacterium]
MSIYNEHNLEPIINASGAVTRLGGAPMPAAVLDAFVAAAGEWVPLEQLQAAASRRIATLTGTEAGLVTAGSAAGLTMGTAAILTGFDLGRMERLPHCDGFPHEILIAREQRSGYDHAIRAAGARLTEVGFNEIVSNAGVRRTEAWEYEAAISDRTAGIVYAFGPGSRPDLEEVVAIGRKHGLPVLVDAAGELPPRANLTAIAALGADLVSFSGGKGIRGPQSTGILCGRRDLIAAAALQMLDMDDHPELWEPPADFIDREKLAGIPRHGIGRALKVSKEEIIALLTALDLFASGAYDKDFARFQSYLEAIETELRGTHSNCRTVVPSHEESWPTLEIAIDESVLGRSAFEVCRRLRNGSPPVYVSHGQLSDGCLVINPHCLNDETATKLARRLCEELS